MTAHYIEKQEMVTKRHLVSTTCDWCGGEVLKPTYDYETRHFELQFTRGTNYGSDYCGANGWHVPDLCDICVEKLKTILIENGVSVLPYDW